VQNKVSAQGEGVNVTFWAEFALSSSGVRKVLRIETRLLGTRLQVFFDLRGTEVSKKKRHRLAYQEVERL
jgi:hypothetical protein